jgi:hypothetical protein
LRSKAQNRSSEVWDNLPGKQILAAVFKPKLKRQQRAGNSPLQECISQRVMSSKLASCGNFETCFDLGQIFCLRR